MVNGLVAATLTVTACLTLASPLHGQTPVPPDSVLARLERAEEQIALLRQQLATQAQTQVQSKSRVQLEFWGRILANAWRNSDGANNLDVPTFAASTPLFVCPGGVLPPPPPCSTRPAPHATAGASLRQTTLGIDAVGMRALGAELSAGISADFFGGVQGGSGNRRLFPEPRLRIARLAMKWNAAEIMIGQDVPLLTPEEPVSLSSLGIPTFTNAGNLWFWLPQLRVSFDTPTRLSVGVQAAVVAPWSGDDPAPTGNIDLAEASGRPFYQSRVRVRWSNAEVGAGAHIGWFLGREASDLAQFIKVRSHGFAATARVPVGWFELRGEAYTGRLLRGLGGAGIGQNFAPSGQTLDQRGGWGQINLQPRPEFLIGGGCGVDHPKRRGSTPVRTRNQACEGHLQLRPAGPVVLGLEVRMLETEYTATRTVKNTHLNLAFGVEF